ncbi:hypothetical protein LTR53_008171 [Teratosphaeriaceae sp. CCFEE 6253]|nr:hypothetical protein LTR53_008171 [Teratosphaeriaceae sp. CCFEE 6253]
MKATFLRARPGDGAWLVRRDDDDRRRGGDIGGGAGTFFAPQGDDAFDRYGRSTTTRPSFLLPIRRSSAVRSRAVYNDVPRTITAKHLLSPDADIYAESEQKSQPEELSTSYKFNAATPSETNSDVTDSEGMDAPKRSKCLPPHLRHKPMKQADSGRDGMLVQEPAASVQDSAEPTAPAPAPSPAPIKCIPPHLRAKATKGSTQTDTDRGHPIVQEPATSPQDSAIWTEPAEPSGKLSADQLREKLSSLGATVSKPEPTTWSAVVSAGLGEWQPSQASAAHRDGGRGRGGKAANSSQQVSETTASADVRQKKTDRGLPASFRGRGRGAQQTRRGGGWPSNKEIKNPKPGRDPAPMSVSGWTVDLPQANQGVGGGWQERALADAGGEALADWSGGWAPAPLDWDARPAFTASSKAAPLEKWMNKVEEAMCGINRAIPKEALLDGDELAPRYWVPIVIGTQAPMSFFREMLASERPEPIHKDDVLNVKPWWEMYMNSQSPRLQEYTQPETAGFDAKAETLEERIAREHDQGPDRYVENKKRTEQAKKQAKREKREQAERRAMEKSHNGVPMGNRIKPDIKLFVRSASPDDMVQIRDIYNHYVSFTCSAPEAERQSAADMQARLEQVSANDLPFLVACEPGAKLPARRGRRQYGDGEAIILPDRIVGFALADNFHDPRPMYRHTCEIEVFTHQEYYMKGVANCLLDKLMALTDPTYVERGGFEVRGEDIEGITFPRIVASLVARMAYDRPEWAVWMTRWLGGMGFEKVADMPSVGLKDGRRRVLCRMTVDVSLAMFSHKTGAEPSPLGSPT